MQVCITRSASKQLSKLPEKGKARVASKITLLANQPQLGKALRGQLAGLYSLRVWPYRIIYQVHTTRREVWVIAIVHRQGVY